MATLKAEAHALQCSAAGPYSAIPTNLLNVRSVCGLEADLIGIRSLSLAARYLFAACSNTFRIGLQKIQTPRGHDLSFFCFESKLGKSISPLFLGQQHCRRFPLSEFVGPRWEVT